MTRDVAYQAIDRLVDLLTKKEPSVARTEVALALLHTADEVLKGVPLNCTRRLLLASTARAIYADLARDLPEDLKASLDLLTAGELR